MMLRILAAIVGAGLLTAIWSGEARALTVSVRHASRGASAVDYICPPVGSCGYANSFLDTTVSLLGSFEVVEHAGVSHLSSISDLEMSGTGSARRVAPGDSGSALQISFSIDEPAYYAYSAVIRVDPILGSQAYGFLWEYVGDPLSYLPVFEDYVDGNYGPSSRTVAHSGVLSAGSYFLSAVADVQSYGRVQTFSGAAAFWFDFTLAPVPEPPAILIVTLALSAILVRRQRS